MVTALLKIFKMMAHNAFIFAPNRKYTIISSLQNIYFQRSGFLNKNLKGSACKDKLKQMRNIWSEVSYLLVGIILSEVPFNLLQWNRIINGGK